MLLLHCNYKCNHNAIYMQSICIRNLHSLTNCRSLVLYLKYVAMYVSIIRTYVCIIYLCVHKHMYIYILLAQTTAQQNSEIIMLRDEVEVLKKENSEIMMLRDKVEVLKKENSEITMLRDEVEVLKKENSEIMMLRDKVEILKKENSEIMILCDKVEVLKKENAQLTDICSKYKSQNDNISTTQIEVCMYVYNYVHAYCTAQRQRCEHSQVTVE